MVEEKEIYDKKRISEEEKNKSIKELVIFALVAFSLYVFHLILPPVLRVSVNFIHLVTK